MPLHTPATESSAARPADAPSSHPSAEAARWKDALRRAVRDPGRLFEGSGTADADRDVLTAHEAFPVLVPPAFMERIRRGDPDDPLLRQVMPSSMEMDDVDGFGADPVGDLDSKAGAGILHKYHGRVLLIGTGACAIHCRYCFRRHFPYGRETAARDRWRGALDYVAGQESISEIILSGGDPLLLDDARLIELGAGLAVLPHVRRLRLHSRVPVVLPERIDGEFLAWLADLHLKKVLVIHVNHANEFGPSARKALDALRHAGITLLNQSVLLRGVNDSARAQIDLAEACMDHGVLPYYLHLLDPVAGAAHYQVDDEQALALMEAMRCRLPGYLVPRLVREIAGAPYKLPVL